MHDQDRSLGETFSEALTLAYEVEQSYSEDIFLRARSLLEECISKIYTLGLFSTNETLEDLQTNSMPYIFSVFTD